MSRHKPIPQGGWYYHKALRMSDLPPPARHVGHVLASLADTKTGEVREPVSLSTLAASTGQGRSTVQRALSDLAAGRFLIRQPPPRWAAVKDHATTRYVVTIPPEYYPDRARPRAGLGQSNNVGHDGSALGPQRAKLGPERAQARSRAGHSYYVTTQGADARSAGAPHASATTAPPQPGQETPHLFADSGQYLDGYGPICLCESVAEADLHQLTPHPYIHNRNSAHDDPYCEVCAYPPNDTTHHHEDGAA